MITEDSATSSRPTPKPKQDERARATVGYVDAPAYDAHDTGRMHPENPRRLMSVREALIQANLDSQLILHSPSPVDLDLVAQVHTQDHAATLERLCGRSQPVDPDTPVVPASWQAAQLAAGAVVDAVEHVLAGAWQSAFCAVRPPGHHALRAHGMGFCLLNNAAIGAQAALNSGKAKRVAILDWDVHHGNGTQDIFYDRADVLYGSWHQYPFYPGTGATEETGTGPGQGFTVNMPLPGGANNQAMLDAWHQTMRPALEHFAPDLIIVSAGFDADARDPLGGLNVTPSGFEDLSVQVRKLADQLCQGRLVSVLEGGYNLQALGEDVAVHVATLL